MATVTTPLMTAEEFYEWANRPENDDKRYELVNGEAVAMPSPGELHGIVCWLIGRYLGNYLFARGGGYMCSNDTGLIVRREPDTVRGPDAMLFLESVTLDRANRGHTDRVPTLVVEVVSPSDTHGRLSRRLAQYMARGIPLVWFIDPDERTVSVYSPSELPKVLDESDELTGNGVLPDFRCRVADLFTLPKAEQPPAPPANPT